MQNAHPLFVHFPIALLSAALFFELLAIVRKNDQWQRASWWMLILGMVAALGAAITGLLAESTVAHVDAAHEWILRHRNLELIAAGFLGVVFIWRLRDKGALPSSGALRIVQRILFVGGVASLLIGAHLGGKLVYDYGVGTSVVQPGEHHHGSTSDDEDNGNVHDHRTKTKEMQQPKQDDQRDTTGAKDDHDIHEHKH